ncbi:MAG TPA: c-type cytochrome [Bryobacteraceae bacterium]
MIRPQIESKLRFGTVLALAFVFFAGASRGADGPPDWAYGTQPTSASGNSAATQGSQKPQGAPNTLKRLPGRASAFTQARIGNRFGPADWYPGDHPEMPDIVAHGRKPDVWACSLCHYPNGKGRPENAGVAGLPVSYFIHQMHDFKNGLRRSADPRKKNTNLMASYAKAMTEDEIKEAADYFGAMKWTPWIKIMETDRVPKTRLSVGMFLPLEGAGKEPLGERIIEVPENPDATEVLRNPRSGFIAYAPFGSIKRGEALVTAGGSTTVQCGLCHGADLKGMGPVPGIAGRSPSYLVRQLYDMQQGTRKGEWTELMKPVVKNLTEEDMLNIAAYVSSRTP